MEITAEQAPQLMKEIIETIYTDGVDEVEFYFDEEENVLWGNFTDLVNGEEDKVFDFTINLDTGEISY